MKYNIWDTIHLQHLAMIILVLPEHNEVDYNSNVDSLSHFERNIFKQFNGGWGEQPVLIDSYSIWIRVNDI